MRPRELDRTEGLAEPAPVGPSRRPSPRRPPRRGPSELPLGARRESLRSRWPPWSLSVSPCLRSSRRKGRRLRGTRARQWRRSRPMRRWLTPGGVVRRFAGATRRGRRRDAIGSAPHEPLDRLSLALPTAPGVDDLSATRVVVMAGGCATVVGPRPDHRRRGDLHLRRRRRGCTSAIGCRARSQRSDSAPGTCARARHHPGRDVLPADRARDPRRPRRRGCCRSPAARSPEELTRAVR